MCKVCMHADGRYFEHINFHRLTYLVLPVPGGCSGYVVLKPGRQDFCSGCVQHNNQLVPK